jgi:hypothetical protein
MIKNNSLYLHTLDERDENSERGGGHRNHEFKEKQLEDNYRPLTAKNKKFIGKDEPKLTFLDKVEDFLDYYRKLTI